MPNSCFTSVRDEPFPRRMPILGIDHIFCSRSVDVLGVEVREASSSAERRITCLWSWTSASSNMSELGCQQRPMTVLVHQREAILPWERLIGPPEKGLP